MAVLKSADGTEMIVSCNCGCDESIHFKVDRDDELDLYCFFSYLSGHFYKEQENGAWKKLKKIWAIIRNKDYYYSDVCMNKKQFEEFRAYIDSI